VIWILVLSTILSTNTTWAGPNHSRKNDTEIEYPSTEMIDLKWLDQLSQAVRSIHLRDFKKAETELKSLQLRSPSKKNLQIITLEIFQDDLIAATTLLQAQKSIKTGVGIKKSIQLIQGFGTHHTSSVIIPRPQELTSELQIRQFEVIKDSQTRVDLLIDVLERIDFPHPRVILSPHNINQFSKLCRSTSQKSFQGIRCRHWLTELIRKYRNESPEAQAIKKGFPQVPTAPSQSATATRKYSTYRSPDQDQKAIDEAISAFVKKEYRGAQELFEKFLSDFPKSSHANRARYWLTRSIQQTDKAKDDLLSIQQKVIQEGPFSLYGLLAAKDLKITPWGRISQAGSSPTGASGAKESHTEIISSLDDSIHFLKIEALLALKNPSTDWVYAEIQKFQSRQRLSQSKLEFWIQRCVELELHTLALSLISELFQREPIDPKSYSKWQTWIFPRPQKLWVAVQKTSEQLQLDPILMMSLIKQESAFDSRAASHAGAWGLMQLMPFTALEVDATLSRSDLLSVERNIQTGGKYFKKLLESFDGSIPLALASYNAGPNAVRRWLKEGRLDEGELLFIEQIPYKETRDYVTSILRNYAWYSSIQNGNEAPIQLKLNEEPRTQDQKSKLKPSA